jgi:L-alanine-DL-glutamate epimerase-like enolase superfamily enzyme
LSLRWGGGRYWTRIIAPEVTDLDAIKAASTDVGDDLVIEFDANNHITLENVQLADVPDFTFHIS